MAVRSDEIATMWQDSKTSLELSTTGKKLDGQGTTSNGPCCKIWKEWATPGREQKHWQKNRVRKRTLVDALCSPEVMNYDNDEL